MVSNLDFLLQISDYDFPIITTNKKIVYYNIPCAFDIEVSSFMYQNKKCACMYIWQFGMRLNNIEWITYGRTWDEFERFTTVLSTILNLNFEKRLIVYVHNFSYEFQFLRKRFIWDKVFFLDERKPVYGIENGFEYRCSWKLSSKSLEKVGEDLQKYKVEKLVGNLDYNLIRLPITPLTQKELDYCINDIRVLLAYIQEKIETDGNISLIPLTNTGYVRNYCRKACFSNYKKYRRVINELTLTPSEYSQLKRGFSGGFTHANPNYVDKIINNVSSFDFTSSYPAVMLLEKFPMSKSRLIKHIANDKELNYYLNHYCCLFNVTFEHLVPIVSFEHPMSKSKAMNCEKVAIDNGRVVTADKITITCTELDLFTYTRFYDWDNITISEFRIYEKGYLPKEFVMAILKLYKDKTVLKDVAEEIVNYMISKNMLNAAYGMTVTDIVREVIEYIDDEFNVTSPNLEEAINKYNNSKKRFLFYPWGVWVTAYARRNLFTGILACKEDYVYSDTDSIKVLNREKHMDYISDYNNQIIQKIEKAAEFHKISKDEFSPLNKKGKPKTIGLWDDEGTYDKFKTIGAKRYMTLKDGKYSLTVAGLHKSKSVKYFINNFKNPFDGLKDGVVVPSEYSGRLTHTYFDEPCDGYIEDYLGNKGEFHELSYIHMEPSEYKLDRSIEYRDYLNALLNLKEIEE